MSRQETRRHLFQKHFERMESTQKHTARPIIGYDSKGRSVRAKERIVTEKRSVRRNLARAFAAGEWRRRNGVLI